MKPAKQIVKDINNDEYNYIHSWIRHFYGKANKCQNPICKCKSNEYQWALRFGAKYETRIKNFIQLCIKCHREYDKKQYPTEFTIKMISIIKKAGKSITNHRII